MQGCCHRDEFRAVSSNDLQEDVELQSELRHAFVS